MSRRQNTIPGDYFEDLYARTDDPWSFATSPYERAKYDATLAALPRAHYRRGLEIGCSIGVLTADLAGRCGTLVAVDVSAKALDRARRRCQAIPNVNFVRGSVPTMWPEGPFDLMLLSEVVYYFHAADVVRLADRALASIAPGGNIVMVHWTGATDYPLGGDEATELFRRALGKSARRIHRHRTQEYRLDCLAVP
jgi:trans-aconitate methyltransferase